METTVAIDSMYGVCIVGAGMIGSSAAKYASIRMRQLGLQQMKVCLIGPEEPKSREGHTIFGAHFDEARITRSTATDVTWGILATRSIARYRQIEKETGIHFYEEVGCLTSGDPSGENFSNVLNTVQKLGVNANNLSAAEAHSRFPYLNITPGNRCIVETINSGYINPRKICIAQRELAKRNGCHVVRHVVTSVIPVTLTNGLEVMKVTTDGGKEIYSRKVLLATGAFTEFHSLLPKRLQLDLQPVTEAVIFVELSPTDLKRLEGMPSMLVKADSSGDVFTTEDWDCYVLPPVKYPDGKVYLKLGHGRQYNNTLTSPLEIVRWYQSKVPTNIQDGLKKMFEFTFPEVKPVSVHFDTCVTVMTPTERPYIDLVTPQLGVALGGNACSAKCCDEFGKLAVELLLKEKWEDKELSREAVRMVIKPQMSVL